jgi:hypothetical protein
MAVRSNRRDAHGARAGASDRPMREAVCAQSRTNGTKATFFRRLSVMSSANKPRVFASLFAQPRDAPCREAAVRLSRGGVGSVFSCPPFAFRISLGDVVRDMCTHARKEGTSPTGS